LNFTEKKYDTLAEKKYETIETTKLEEDAKGTLNYLSPEMCADFIATSTSDLWAFAIILYRMLVGKPAFKGTELHQVMKMIMDEGEKAIEWPEDFDPVAKSFILEILV
jgi:3-phosphoinositide dependent protein kinase-1